MAALRASMVVAALLALTLTFSSSSTHSFVRSVSAETKTVNLQPFRGISICAPISVRIVDSNSSESSGENNRNRNGGFSARLTGDKKAIDAVSLTTTASSLAVELPRGDLDTGPGTLELEIRLPARTLQYVERVHARGDTAILSEFDPEKAEVASSGAGNIWIPFLNGRRTTGDGREEGKRLQMAKISLSSPGKVVAHGDAGFWEVFAADEAADVRIDGVAEGGEGLPLYSTVSVRLDAGRARVQPSATKSKNVVSITGFALAPRNAKPAVLQYTSGECSARREAFGGIGNGWSDGGTGDDAALPALGSACELVAPLPSPAAPPPLSWTCGVRTSGRWTCGGPGDKGARPGTVESGTECAAPRDEVESISRA